MVPAVMEDDRAAIGAALQSLPLGDPSAHAVHLLSAVTRGRVLHCVTLLFARRQAPAALPDGPPGVTPR